ncbi:MAG: penicillin-binding protein 1A [Rickettsiales bacterium]|nr:penicillin-binding protein 1A [Rickettsiales bacterium]
MQEPRKIEAKTAGEGFTPPPKPRQNKLEIFLISFFFCSVMVLLTLIFVFVKYGVDLPDYVKLAEYKPPVTSRFYAGDGSLLTEYATEKRIFVELDDIPPNLINAFISAEDKNFWTHSGIEITGIFKAVFRNIRNMILGSSRMSGGSTITQQVAKNFFLTSEKTFARKIREAILALKMERTFSKRHILTLYLNQIFLGYRSFGVAAAAQNYFGKSLSELTLAECAFLAALPKAPSTYDPVTNKDKAVARRDWVLERMAANGHISNSDYALAVGEDIEVSDSFISRRQKYALYFSEDARRQLAAIYGEEQLYSGGLAVRTSLNPKYQEIATKVLRRALLSFDAKQGWRGAEAHFDLKSPEWMKDETIRAQVNDKGRELWEILLSKADISSGMEDEGWRRAMVLDVSPDSATIGMRGGGRGTILAADSKWTGQAELNTVLRPGDVVFAQKKDDAPDAPYMLRQVPEINGAMVVLDPHTGRIFALVGGFAFTRSKFNRATQAYRQIGSTIKPFVYLAALESGRYTPSSILLDAPVVMEKENGEMWSPENYDDTFEGELTFRRALEKSKNNPTVRLALDVGLRKFIKAAVDFGVYQSVKNPNLSMALGSGDTTLLDLTGAFAKLINGGRQIKTTLVDRVQDRDGRTVFKSDERECDGCIVPWDAELVPPDIMDDRAQLANPVSVYQIVHILEGVVQRGSGWQARIPGRTIGGKTGTSNEQQSVWFVGGTPDLVAGVFLGYDQPKSLGNYTTGGSLAAPIFRDFMAEVLKGAKDVSFRVPPGVTFVRVNRETGRPAKTTDSNYNTILEAFAEGTEESILSSPTAAPPADEGEREAQPDINLDGIY